jgi:hypothetical protein
LIRYGEIVNLCAATAATWTHRWQPTSVWERKLNGAQRLDPER